MKNRLVTVIALVVFAGLAMACGGLSIREHFSRYALPRASFELRCPAERITLVQVSAPLDQLLFSGGVTVGATGCGRRAVYIVLNNGTWVLNSVSRGGR